MTANPETRAISEARVVPERAITPFIPLDRWCLEVQPPTEPARREWRLTHPLDRDQVLYLYRLRVNGSKVRQVGCTRAVCLAMGWPAPSARLEEGLPLTWEQKAAADRLEQESNCVIEEAFRAALERERK